MKMELSVEVTEAPELQQWLILEGRELLTLDSDNVPTII